MTKRKATCPECEHQFTIEFAVQAKTVGVRASPGPRKGEFNYEITMPEHVSSDSVRFSNIRDDLIGAAILGVLAGGTCGLIAATFFPGYEGQVVIIGASIATTYAWGLLQAETNQRLKATLPWFVRQRSNWQAGVAQADPGTVTLTVDHRYESGRTIQYFGELPVDVDRFNSWAEAILGTGNLPGETLAIDNWTPLAKRKLFSRTEYQPLLAHMVKCGAANKLPGKGHILTGGGRRALRQHLKAHPPTAQEHA